MGAKYIAAAKSPRIQGFEWQEPEDDYDRDVFRNILTHGCTILQILPDEQNPSLHHDFVYTIGFYLNLLHPEFLIMSVTAETAGPLLNRLFSDIEKGNQIDEGHTVTYDFGKGDRKLIARTVPQERYFDYLGYGCWFYRSLLWKEKPIAAHKFPVLQLFWPDPSGRYPWDPDCDPRAKRVQTLVKQKS